MDLPRIGKFQVRRLATWIGLAVVSTITVPPLRAWPELELDSSATLQVSVSDLNYSKFDGRVYACGPANLVTGIDPMTGALGPSIPVGNNPSRLAISDDGQHLYVLSNGGNQIDWIRLAGGYPVFSFTLGSSASGPFRASAIAVAPGQPTTLAVSCSDGAIPGREEVRIYDGAVARPTVYSAAQPWIAEITRLAFGSNASSLYAFDASGPAVVTLAADPAGVSLVSTHISDDFARNSDIACVGESIYTTSRGVFDLSARQMQFPFGGADSFSQVVPFALDPPMQRICFLEKVPYSSQLDRIRVFDLRTYLPVGSIPVAPTFQSGGPIIRWGADGLAYRVGSDSIVFLRTRLLPSAPECDLVVHQRYLEGGVEPAQLQFLVENRGPNPAEQVRLTIQFVESGAQYTPAVHEFGTQEAGTTNIVTIEFDELPTTPVLVTASVSSVSRELQPANNTHLHVLAIPKSSEGEPTVKVLLPVVDLASDPVRGGLYLALDNQMPDVGNGVVYFDPNAGTFTHATFVGPDIRRVVLSPDSQFLVASSLGKMTRLATDSLSVLDEIPLADHLGAFDLAISSTDPNRIAVWHEQPPGRLVSRRPVGLGIYENRMLVVTNWVEAGWSRVALSKADGTIDVVHNSNGFAIESFRQTGDTITLLSEVQYPYLDFYGEIKAVAPRYFAPRGRVYDSATARVSGTFDVPGIDGWPNVSSGEPLVEPDLENGRVFFLRHDVQQVVKLHAFDASRYQLIGSRAVPGVNGTPRRMIRWGKDGMAFITDRLFLLRSRLIPDGPEADLSLQLAGGANPGHVGWDEPYVVNVRNLGPEPIEDASVVLSVSNSGEYSEIASTTGAVVSSGTGLTWTTGPLAPGVLESLAFELTPRQSGMMQIEARVSAACRDRNPSNDRVASLEMVTDSNSGGQFTRLSLPANDLISKEHSPDLFVSLADRGGTIGNSILRVNPITWQILGRAYVGSNPHRLALSADGSRLYAGLDGECSIVELDPVTLQSLDSFSIGPGLQAGSLAVAPGTTHRLLVYRPHAGLSVFDYGEELEHRVGEVSSFVFDDLTGLAYGCDQNYSGVPLYRLAIDSGGVTVASILSTALQQSQSDLKAAQGLLYYDYGLVVDGTLESESGRFPTGTGTSRVQPALDRGLVYFLNRSGNKWSMRAFNAMTRQPAGIQPMPGLNGSPGRLNRWGATGLAFVTSANQLAVLRDLFTSDASLADLGIGKITTPQVALPETALLYSCAITNHSDDPASSTTVTQTFTLAGAIQNAQATVGTVQHFANEVIWRIGELANGSSARLEVQVFPFGPQTIASEIRVTTSSYDPHPANNVARTYTPVQAYSTNPVMTVVNLPVADLIYQPSRGKLWASLNDVAEGSCLVPIDPVAGVVGPGINTWSEASRLALDADGMHLYCLQPEAGAVARVDTDSGRLDQFTSLGYHPTFGFFQPLDLAASPSSSQRVAVSVYSSGIPSNVVAELVDGAIQPDLGHSWNRLDVIEYGDNDDVLYGFNNSSSLFQLSKYEATGAGFVLITNRQELITGFGADLKRVGPLLIGSAGQVIDPSLLTLITNLSAGISTTAVEPDEAGHRIYFATSSPHSIRAFNSDDFSPTGTTQLSGLVGQVRSLVRWGGNGLAMHTSGGQILIVRTPLVPISTPQDTDGDGLPDDWESRYGMNPYSNADASLDFDGDGLSSLGEFRAGTNPYQATSTFRVGHLSLDDDMVELVFPSNLDRTYRIETSSKLLPSDWSILLEGIQGTGLEITRKFPSVSSNAFFRLHAQPGE